MAALFGPLAGVSFTETGTYPPVASYASATPLTNRVEPSWWRYLGLGQRTLSAAKPTTPVYPVPPKRIFDTPRNGLPFGPVPATVVGAQKTRADRLFGPFARIGSITPTGSLGLSRGTSFPEI